MPGGVSWRAEEMLRGMQGAERVWPGLSSHPMLRAGLGREVLAKDAGQLPAIL